MALKSVSCAAFGATAILTGAILIGPGASSTEAATNFNKNGQCRLIETAEGTFNTCLCPPASQLRKLRRPPPGFSLTACYAAARQQANVAPDISRPGPGPGPGPGPTLTDKADNGWGNGPDGTNNGSFSGGGIAQGGQGVGQTQTESKDGNPNQR
jgi:hypothetical protein